MTRLRDRSSTIGTIRGTAATDGRSVLVVDPDARIRQQVASWLRAEGYHVHQARTFEIARDMLASARPQLLVVELRLGLFNGLQLAIRARAQQPPVPVIVTSTVADVVLEKEARRCGALWLMKPITQTRLRDLVGALLGAVEGSSAD